MRSRIVAVLAGMLVAGCGAGAELERAADAAEPRCPVPVSEPAEGTDAVPATFEVAWVLRCRGDMRAFPGEGRWAVQVEERADTDAADLLTALGRPDEKASGDVLCTAVKHGLPYFVLVGRDGSVVRPRAPLGKVSGTELTALLAELDTLPAARPCTAKHRTFAVLQYSRRGWYDDAAYVELDGCRMILRPDETRGELTPALAAALVRLGGG